MGSTKLTITAALTVAPSMTIPEVTYKSDEKLASKGNDRRLF
jgi:hypothetical protein